MVKKKEETTSTSIASNNIDDFTNELIKEINKKHQDKIAFNLGSDAAPTNINRWISTGSRMLDAVVSNTSKGGLPEGRIVEIQGPPSIGKSHIGFELAKSTQRHGGIVVYIDTENATSLDNLRGLGIKVNSQFVFVQTACTEEIFEVAEQAIMKARQLKKDVPVTIIWDSVAASSPKAELEGDYDQNSIGLQARVLGKGLRKITQLIANQKVLFVLFNQQRQKIGVMYGDPTTTPGGAAIPYACSTRIRLYGGSHIQDDKTKEVIGIAVKAKTIKNKVARPFREAEFEIHFGVGVREDQQAFDAIRRWCDATGPVEMPNGEKVSVAGTGAWKTFIVTDAKGNTVVEEKWQGKADFGSRVYYNPQYEKYVTALLDASFIVSAENDREHPTYVDVDTESYEDFRSLASS